MSSSNAVAFELSGVPRTLLIPLLARARSREVDASIPFEDPWARRWLSLLEGAEGSIRMLERESWMLEGCLTRAVEMDERTLAYLRRNDATRSIVVTLGAGLCSRPQRLAALEPASRATRWIEVDFPEVIALKKSLCERTEASPAPQWLASSITTRGFLRPALAGAEARARAALVIIEGVLLYLEPAEVRSVIEDVAATLLEAGATEIRFLFDIAHPALQAVSWRPSFLRKERAWFRWGVRDPRRLEGEIPGLHPVLVRNLASGSGARIKRWGARLIEIAGLHPYALVEAEWRTSRK